MQTHPCGRGMPRPYNLPYLRLDYSLFTKDNTIIAVKPLQFILADVLSRSGNCRIKRKIKYECR
uniref:Uncharacterized protein n=1 Tax=Prevotella sp. GTC17259 TaxID=3236795 RepID=A0AB33J6E7_9BACT